jgi:hypothetical protein
MVEELVQQLAQEIAAVNPDAAEIFMSLPPDGQEAIMQVAAQAGTQAAVDVLLQLAQDLGIPTGQGGATPVGPGGPEGTPPLDGVQTGPPMDPTQLPPPELLAQLGAGGPPPTGGPLPPDVQAQMDSMMPPQQGAGGRGDGPAPPSPPQPDVPKENPDAKVPEPKKWQPPGMKPSKFAKTPPKLSRVLQDARTFRQEYRARDSRIKDDVELLHGTYDLDIDSDEGNFINGNWVHRRADPWVYVNKIVSLTAASEDRYKVHVPKRHPSKKYVDASQKFEDYVRSCRIHDEETWFERGMVLGDPQMPLPRKEAGLMALEGGLGWKWHVDPENEEHPFQYELIPVSQLYPGGHAMVRQYELPLHKARAEFEELETAFPLENDEDDLYKGRPNSWREDMPIRFIEWSDNAGYWHAIAWEDASPWRGKASIDNRRSGWIQKPQRIGYGIPMFGYITWGGTFASPMTSSQGADFTAYQGTGVLTPLRRTFRLMDIMVSAVATGAIRFTNPPVLRKVAEGRDMMKVPELSWEPGAENFVRPDEDVKPLAFEIAQSANGTAFIQALGQELNAAIPPVMMGGQAVSGLDRMKQQEDATSTVVQPIIDALQRTYEILNRQRGILAYRFAKRDKDGSEWKDREYFDEYTYSSSRKRGYQTFGTLKPKDIELSGVNNHVRYDFKTLSDRMQLAQYAIQLTQAHLMEQEEALILLGRDDPQAAMSAIIQDAAMMEPEVLKAMVEAYVVASGNPVLIDAWMRVFYARPQQGSAPAQAGMPSAPNQSGQEAPGLPPQMTGPQGMM